MADDRLSPAEAFAMLRGDGQPAIFVDAAVLIAASADATLAYIRSIVYAKGEPLLPTDAPATRRWLTMYRRHRMMQGTIGTAIGLESAADASAVLDALRGLSRATEEEIAAEVATMTEEEHREFLAPFMGVPFPPDDATLRGMLAELDAEDEADAAAALDAFIATPEGRFYLGVWLPCWILYREYPPRLLRAARCGDIGALDRLLRLDKLAAADPVVARHVARIMGTGTPGSKKRIVDALAGRPSKRITDKAMRSGLGALISQFAVVCHTRVTAPEIQTLFDRIAAIRTGQPADPAIPAGEAWSKAIQRNRNWPMPERG